MGTNVGFLAEFGGGAPTRAALELAAGAASLAAESGGSAVALAYGPGAADSSNLGPAGAAAAIVLGTDASPAITIAGTLSASVASGDFAVILAPATPNGRDLAAALVGLQGLSAFGPVRAISLAGGIVRCEQATLQGSVITVSELAAGAAGPAVVLVAAARKTT
jgi:hypothetical protein